MPEDPERGTQRVAETGVPVNLWASATNLGPRPRAGTLLLLSAGYPQLVPALAGVREAQGAAEPGRADLCLFAHAPPLEVTGPELPPGRCGTTTRLTGPH